MEHCKACMPAKLIYDINIAGETNLSHLDNIVTYLNKQSLLVNRSTNVISVKEEAVQGLIDYMQDHMDMDDITYRIGKNDWINIREVGEVLELQWIDNVIFNNEVSFHIQPIIDTEEKIVAHEMLARFTDEKGSPIGPFLVFEAARKRNRTYALDRVCRMAAVRNSVYVEGKVFINFIPTSIYSPEHCLKSTVQLAQELGMKPDRFVFEVVETEKVDDLDHLKEILAYYRKKGFHYALDDVGDGYSTIDMLEQLEPHYMKLDMKFTQGISSDFSKQQAAKKIYESAIKVGAVPLAEGIEERADFDWLKKNGFKLFQGYLFGKPAPIIMSTDKSTDVI